MADLFDTYPAQPGAARHSATSIKAAEDIKVRQGTIQAKVLLALRNNPLASWELPAHTGVSYRSVQPRTAELARSTMDRPALIMDSGQTRRDPDTGKQATVWKLTPRGIDVAFALSGGE
jgi:hypothetical protein